MSDRLGVAVIGCGMAAMPHARALLELQNELTVIGVYARTATSRKRFCETWGFPEALSDRELLDDPRVGMVLLLTPPDARQEWIEAAAARQIPVLMEKPVERDSRAAEMLVKKLESAKTAFGIMFQHRFRSASLALRSHVQSGTLGALRMVKADVPWWREQSYYDEPGRGSYARDGGGVLISQAIHTLDLMLSLTGPVREVRALTATTGFHQMESEDFAVAGLRFENGAVGTVTATTAAYPGGAESLEFFFERATARLCSGVLQLQYHDGKTLTEGENQQTGAGADPMAFPHDWHLAVIADFAHSVKQGIEPAITAREALNVHRLIDAITLASDTGTPTTPDSET